MCRNFPRFCTLFACCLVVLMLGACSEDDEAPAPTAGSGVPTGGSSGGGGTGGGNGETDAGGDAGADVDADAGYDNDVAQGCDLEPSGQPTYPQYPCCFEDSDCHESAVPNAEEMRCYYSTCEEGGEGTCRHPPDQQQQCWDDHDCPDGSWCPHENDPEAFGCQQPQLIETPATCADD